MVSPLFVFTPAVYPTNAQFQLHFKEFLSGYRASAESVEITFPKAKSCRSIQDFSVGIADGFLKTLAMIGITVIIHELEPRLNYITSSEYSKSQSGFIWVALTKKTEHTRLSQTFPPTSLSGIDRRADGGRWSWSDLGVIPVGAVQLHPLSVSQPLFSSCFETLG